MERMKRAPQRGVTLLEIMVVCAIGTGVAATATVNIVEQVKRTRAVSAAGAALHPHAASRDRAVASRTCTETILIPAKGQGGFTPPSEPVGVRKFPDPAQRDVPRIAVIEWSNCTTTAAINRVDFYDLDGDITLAPYNTGDGRVVFGIDGGITTDRPGPTTSRAVGSPSRCRPPKGTATTTTTARTTAPTTTTTTSCSAPLPTQKTAPPADVTFSATTYFGSNVDYRIYARVGAVENVSP